GIALCRCIAACPRQCADERRRVEPRSRGERDEPGASHAITSWCRSPQRAALEPAPKSALPGKPGAHSARRRAGLGVTIVQRVRVDETENVSPFLVRSHHQLGARRKRAPERLILIPRRVRTFQVPDEGVPLLLRYDQRSKSAAPPFDLGNAIPLSGPGPDQ